MNYIKSYIDFLETLNYNDMYNGEYEEPVYNPALRLEAKEFVEQNIAKDVNLLFKVAKMDFPTNVSSEEMDDIANKATKKAIQFYIDNPELMQDPTFDYLKGDKDNVVPIIHENETFKGYEKITIDVFTDLRYKKAIAINNNRQKLILARLNITEVVYEHKAIDFEKDFASIRIYYLNDDTYLIGIMREDATGRRYYHCENLKSLISCYTDNLPFIQFNHYKSIAEEVDEKKTSGVLDLIDIKWKLYIGADVLEDDYYTYQQIAKYILNGELKGNVLIEIKGDNYVNDEDDIDSEEADWILEIKNI